MREPKCIGLLSAQQAKGKKAFSFEYEKDWIQSKEQMLLDPDIGWYSLKNIQTRASSNW
jgi:serine/threonine-protein kinase HipA